MIKTLGLFVSILGWMDVSFADITQPVTVFDGRDGYRDKPSVQLELDETIFYTRFQYGKPLYICSTRYDHPTSGLNQYLAIRLTSEARVEVTEFDTGRTNEKGRGVRYNADARLDPKDPNHVRVNLHMGIDCVAGPGEVILNTANPERSFYREHSKHGEGDVKLRCLDQDRAIWAMEREASFVREWKKENNVPRPEHVVGEEHMGAFDAGWLAWEWEFGLGNVRKSKRYKEFAND